MTVTEYVIDAKKYVKLQFFCYSRKTSFNMILAKGLYLKDIQSRDSDRKTQC